MATRNDSVVAYNASFGDRSEDIWFSSTDGDLSIWNLMLIDAGLYKCQFTGSGDKYIQLVVQGMLLHSI